MTKRNFKYVLDKQKPTKIHTKTGEVIPNYKKVSANKTTWGLSRNPIRTRVPLQKSIDDHVDRSLIESMIHGTNLKILSMEHAGAQLKHLRKYRNRTTKRLARDTKLPCKVVKRFKELA